MTAPHTELREKVEGRQKQLEEALNVLSDLVGGGWEQMTDATAERLAGWLESTRGLQGEKPRGGTLVVPPQPAQEKLAARDKIN